MVIIGVGAQKSEMEACILKRIYLDIVPYFTQGQENLFCKVNSRGTEEYSI